MEHSVNRRPVLIRNISTHAAWGLQQTKEKRGAAFFHYIRDDTYICSIFREKILLSVFHELNEVQLFIVRLPSKPQVTKFFLFACRRLAPLEQIKTLHILTVKIKT